MLPSVNHCMPDATVKRAGVGEERRTAATPPVRRPVVPGRRLAERNRTLLNSFCELSENGLGHIWFNSKMEI